MLVLVCATHEQARWQKLGIFNTTGGEVFKCVVKIIHENRGTPPSSCSAPGTRRRTQSQSTGHDDAYTATKVSTLTLQSFVSNQRSHEFQQVRTPIQQNRSVKPEHNTACHPQLHVIPHSHIHRRRTFVADLCKAFSPVLQNEPVAFKQCFRTINETPSLVSEPRIMQWRNCKTPLQKDGVKYKRDTFLHTHGG